MAGFSGWRVRRGAAVRRFSDGLVVQTAGTGSLDLAVCRVAEGHPSHADIGLLRPLVAACASEGIRRDTGIVSWLHWPDLVTIGGRVVAKTSLSIGAGREADQVKFVLSISVNCFSSVSLASAAELPGTSILEALGVEIDLDLLRDKILHALDWYYAEWERGMHAKLVERIQPTIPWLGGGIKVRMVDGRVLRGTARGLDVHGSLLLEPRQGNKREDALALSPGSVELVLAE